MVGEGSGGFSAQTLDGKTAGRAHQSRRWRGGWAVCRWTVQRPLGFQKIGLLHVPETSHG